MKLFLFIVILSSTSLLFAEKSGRNNTSKSKNKTTTTSSDQDKDGRRGRNATNSSEEKDTTNTEATAQNHGSCPVDCDESTYAHVNTPPLTASTAATPDVLKEQKRIKSEGKAVAEKNLRLLKKIIAKSDK